MVSISTFQTFFGFLRRRTDLFVVMQSPDAKSGFSPGKAEELVLKSFRKNQAEFNGTARVTTPSAVSVPVRSSISAWNGSVTDKYRWSQSISDLTVELSLPCPIATKTDLNVNLSSSELNISVNGKKVLFGEFGGKIIPTESTWMIEDDRQTVLLYLDKLKSDWWKSFLIGDPEIDTTKIESTKRVDEYDTETQGAIRKIIHNNKIGH